MRYRKLRIAWSVGWGIVAFIACLFCVRSYVWDTHFWLDIGKPTVDTKTCRVLRFNRGHLQIYTEDVHDTGNDPAIGWWSKAATASEEPRNGVTCSMPVAIFVAITTGAVAWFPFQQFSLRTLLIATTFVAVVLGLVLWAMW